MLRAFVRFLWILLRTWDPTRDLLYTVSAKYGVASKLERLTIGVELAQLDVHIRLTYIGASQGIRGVYRRKAARIVVWALKGGAVSESGIHLAHVKVSLNSKRNLFQDILTVQSAWHRMVDGHKAYFEASLLATPHLLKRP